MADCARVVSGFSSIYIPFQLGQLQMGTTALDEGDRLEEDLASIPDLVAGSLADVVTSLATVRGWFLAPYFPTAKAKRKSNTVVKWLSRIPKRLRHISIAFESLGGAQVALFPLEFD